MPAVEKRFDPVAADLHHRMMLLALGQRRELGRGIVFWFVAKPAEAKDRVGGRCHDPGEIMIAGRTKLREIVVTSEILDRKIDSKVIFLRRVIGKADSLGDGERAARQSLPG